MHRRDVPAALLALVSGIASGQQRRDTRWFRDLNIVIDHLNVFVKELNQGIFDEKQLERFYAAVERLKR